MVHLPHLPKLMLFGYLLLRLCSFSGSYIQIETWEDEEDEYLANLVSQNMLLNSGKVNSFSSHNLRNRFLTRQMMFMTGAKTDLVSNMQARRAYGESHTHLLQHV